MNRILGTLLEKRRVILPLGTGRASFGERSDIADHIENAADDKLNTDNFQSPQPRIGKDK